MVWVRRGPSRDGSASTSVATSPTEDTHSSFTHVSKYAPARASLDLWAPRAGTIPEESPSHASQLTDDQAAAEDNALASVRESPEQSSSKQTGRNANAASHLGGGSGSQNVHRSAEGEVMSSMFAFDASPDNAAGKLLRAPYAAFTPLDTEANAESQPVQNEQCSSDWGESRDEHSWDGLSGGGPVAADVQGVITEDGGITAEVETPSQDSAPQDSPGVDHSKPARLAVGSSQDSDSLALSPIQQIDSRGSVAREPSDIANPLWESWEGKLANLTDLPEVPAAGVQPIEDQSAADQGDFLIVPELLP